MIAERLAQNEKVAAAATISGGHGAGAGRGARRLLSDAAELERIRVRELEQECHEQAIRTSLARRSAPRFFTRAGSGLAGIALAAHARTRTAGRGRRAADPLAPKKPHFTPTAKSVIWLFMEGGPSHIDLFDPKPKLNELAGQPCRDRSASSSPRWARRQHADAAPSARSSSTARAASGSPTGYPHIAEHVDDLAVIRSCWADGLNHVGWVCQMNTGSILAGRPSLGAWVTYGLGTANQNLPAFVVLHGRQRSRVGGPQELERRLPARDLPGHAVPAAATRRSCT